MNTAVLAVLGMIVHSVYAQSDYNELGYNVGQTNIKYENGGAELTCFISKKTYPVHWNKIDINGMNDPIEISIGTKLIIQDSRFSLHIHYTGLLFTIKIENIRESDAGVYQCSIIPKYGRKLASIKLLEVPHPAKIYDITIRSLVFKEGEEVTLECYAAGHPMPNITWSRQNNTILPAGGLVYNGNVYTIPSITRHDRGIYFCIAENGVGKPDKRNVGVEVEFLPVVNITTTKQLVLHTDYDISCKIYAFPLPVIIWIKDEVQLINTQHYKISQVATVDKWIISTVHVIHIEKKHYGNYTCQASNEIGSANDTINIHDS